MVWRRQFHARSRLCSAAGFRIFVQENPGECLKWQNSEIGVSPDFCQDNSIEESSEKNL